MKEKRLIPDYFVDGDKVYDIRHIKTARLADPIWAGDESNGLVLKPVISEDNHHKNHHETVVDVASMSDEAFDRNLRELSEQNK